jgi:hypothetical protein
MKPVEFCAARLLRRNSIPSSVTRTARADTPYTQLPSGLPENEKDGRLGEARRVTLAVVDVADNVRGELSAHVITISQLNRKKIARPIECVGCNWSSRSAVRRAPDGPQVNAERARSHKFEGEAGMAFTPAFMSRIADGLEIAGGAAVIVLSQDPVHDESASSPLRFRCPSLT